MWISSSPFVDMFEGAVLPAHRIGTSDADPPLIVISLGLQVLPLAGFIKNVNVYALPNVVGRFVNARVKLPVSFACIKKTFSVLVL